MRARGPRPYYDAYFLIVCFSYYFHKSAIYLIMTADIEQNNLLISNHDR